jgi:hypothetical protein
MIKTFIICFLLGWLLAGDPAHGWWCPAHNIGNCRR